MRRDRATRTSARTTRTPRAADPSVLNGYGERDSQLGLLHRNPARVPRLRDNRRLLLQHRRLLPRLAPVQHSKRVTDNLLVGTGGLRPVLRHGADRSALAGGGGYQVCGLYNVKQTKFGQSQNFVTRPASSASSRARTTSSTSRSTPGWPSGSGSMAASTPAARCRDNCFVVDSRRNSRQLPHRHAVQGADAVQGARRFPLRQDVIVGFAYQNLSGPTYNATWTATRRPRSGLGRPLSGGATTVRQHPARRSANAVRGSHHAARPPAVALVHDRAVPCPAEPGRVQRVERELGPRREQDLRIRRAGDAAWQRPTQILESAAAAGAGDDSF